MTALFWRLCMFLAPTGSRAWWLAVARRFEAEGKRQ